MTDACPDSKDIAFLHSDLDEMLERFALFHNAVNDDERAGWANVCIRDAGNFVQLVCGSAMLAAAYGPDPDSNDHPAVLRTLASRLGKSAVLFGDLDRADVPGSIGHAALEATAVANGDSPQLFAKRSRKVGYRMARSRLRAFEWDAYLEALGVPDYERQARIALTHQQQWDTIRKWPASFQDILGRNRVDDDLRAAKLLGSSRYPFWGMSKGELWQDALAKAGDMFVRAAHANKASG